MRSGALPSRRGWRGSFRPVSAALALRPLLEASPSPPQGPPPDKTAPPDDRTPALSPPDHRGRTAHTAPASPSPAECPAGHYPTGAKGPTHPSPRAYQNNPSTGRHARECPPATEPGRTPSPCPSWYAAKSRY